MSLKTNTQYKLRSLKNNTQYRLRSLKPNTQIKWGPLKLTSIVLTSLNSSYLQRFSRFYNWPAIIGVKKVWVFNLLHLLRYTNGSRTSHSTYCHNTLKTTITAKLSLRLYSNNNYNKYRRIVNAMAITITAIAKNCQYHDITITIATITGTGNQKKEH